ncbi:hypothetical protein HLB44_14430 [Aquincola sp. S2]|uniref:Uncharacterized protein n=1 Tax=Pseudaquabacterium terrae TaxID=2732868 RepID=A0ABX2EHS1_9BURK|nr:hypothetical protein [Aquabacterium terrae]NRF68187.1 hypothetical protein [Aquabacterium terrae]
MDDEPIVLELVLGLVDELDGVAAESVDGLEPVLPIVPELGLVVLGPPGVVAVVLGLVLVVELGAGAAADSGAAAVELVLGEALVDDDCE